MSKRLVEKYTIPVREWCVENLEWDNIPELRNISSPKEIDKFICGKIDDLVNTFCNFDKKFRYPLSLRHVKKPKDKSRRRNHRYKYVYENINSFVQFLQIISKQLSKKQKEESSGEELANSLLSF